MVGLTIRLTPINVNSLLCICCNVNITMDTNRYNLQQLLCMSHNIDIWHSALLSPSTWRAKKKVEYTYCVWYLYGWVHVRTSTTCAPKNLFVLPKAVEFYETRSNTIDMRDWAFWNVIYNNYYVTQHWYVTLSLTV